MASLRRLALLLCVALASMAANGQELLLPDDPEAACTAATMFEATSKEHECSKTLYHREEAGAGPPPSACICWLWQAACCPCRAAAAAAAKASGLACTQHAPSTSPT